MCVCVCTTAHTRVMCASVYVHACVRACARVSMCVRVHACADVCIRAHGRCVRVHTCACVSVHVHMLVCTCACECRRVSACVGCVLSLRWDHRLACGSLPRLDCLNKDTPIPLSSLRVWPSAPTPAPAGTIPEPGRLRQGPCEPPGAGTSCTQLQGWCTPGHAPLPGPLPHAQLPSGLLSPGLGRPPPGASGAKFVGRH